VREAVKERDSTTAELDAVLFPEAWPPPITTQVQSLGGATAAVIGAFCEHSPEIHAMAVLWAVRRAPTAADDLGSTVPLDSELLLLFYCPSTVYQLLQKREQGRAMGPVTDPRHLAPRSRPTKKKPEKLETLPLLLLARAGLAKRRSSPAPPLLFLPDRRL
jgi:hypothetical protein